GRALSRGRRRATAAREPSRLRAGRRDRALHRHQADRPSSVGIRMKTLLRPAVSLFVALTVVTGVAYPLLVTAIAQGVFPHQANGSPLMRDGKLVGSELIGQAFSDPKYFWSRPSATSPPYNGGSSGGSNLGPLNPALADAVKARVQALRDADPGNTRPVPV